MELKQPAERGWFSSNESEVRRLSATTKKTLSGAAATYCISKVDGAHSRAICDDLIGWAN